MSKILLLYDTQEEDLSRDFEDLLAEFDIKVTMIPLSSNKGQTLQDKEEHYFDSADGAIFLITPRIEKSPSSSISHEMGQAKQKFKNMPEKVIYLVDRNCAVPTIDQKPYIQFDRNNMRSIVKAITLFIKDLKLASCFGQKKIEQKETQIDIAKFSESIDEKLKKICSDLSGQPSGSIALEEFKNLLKSKYNMSEQDINFAIIDLTEKKLVQYYQPSFKNLYGGYHLINIGWKLVRHEKEQEKRNRGSLGLRLLDSAQALRQISAISPDYAIPPANKALGLLTKGHQQKK